MVDVPENFSMTPDQMAQMQQPNPLAQYMRQPAVYIKLPSGGEFWPYGALEVPVSGELPVMPMSTRDEIALNTPDALMNGQAVVDMIHSCVPNIKNAWGCPALDVDTILIAIRIASYGETMEYTSTCPKCENADNYEIDLKQFLEMPVDLAGFQTPLEYNGMQLYMKPSDYETINNQNLEAFEQSRIVAVVNNIDMAEEEKQQRFNEIFRKMTEYTVRNVSNSILRIVTPDGQTVSDADHIADFVRNSERQLYEAIKNYVTEINKGIPEKIVNTQCAECSEQYTTPFTFDQANFFAFAS